MKTTLECAAMSDTAAAAASRMRDKNIGFLPVCDASGKMTGTLTDRDLALRVLADGKPADTTIEQLMTREIVSCRPEDELRTAEQLMARHHKSRIVCMDGDGHPLGVISLSDIAQRERGKQASRVLREVSQREARL